MKDIQCRGCFHAEISVEYHYRPISPLSWYGREVNELAIYCKKRARMVRYPFEKCPDRLERPKVPIDAWQK